MPSSVLFMLAIFLLGIIGRSNIIAAAAGILLVLQIANIQFIFPVLEDRGLDLGLLFLVISVLVPFASGRISFNEISSSVFTLSSLIAFISGLIATLLNERGLGLLQREPGLMVGLVLGSIIGVSFFRGIPVGPLMAAGIAAAILAVLNFFR